MHFHVGLSGKPILTDLHGLDRCLVFQIFILAKGVLLIQAIFSTSHHLELDITICFRNIMKNIQKS